MSLMTWRVVERDGVQLRVRDDQPGWPHFWDIWENGMWEPRSFDVLERTLRPDAWFVDVGAWVGPLTLWSASRGARVLAIEPDVVAYDALCANVMVNALYDRVEIAQAAIGPETRDDVAIIPAPDGEYGDSLSRVGVGDEGVHVPMRTLPQLLWARGIDIDDVDLVKIDTEGYETEICPSLMPWLAGCHVPVQVAFHGTPPDPAWFEGFSSVELPEELWGDLVAWP